MGRKRTSTRPADLLSPLEGEVMAAVWKHPRSGVGEATVFVNETRRRELSERTVATILRRLDAKGHVTHEVVGRAFLYTATVPEQQFVAWHGRQVIAALVRRYGAEIAVAGLFDGTGADQATLDLLDRLLAERRKGAP